MTKLEGDFSLHGSTDWQLLSTGHYTTYKNDCRRQLLDLALIFDHNHKVPAQYRYGDTPQQRISRLHNKQGTMYDNGLSIYNSWEIKN